MWSHRNVSIFSFHLELYSGHAWMKIISFCYVIWYLQETLLVCRANVSIIADNVNTNVYVVPGGSHPAATRQPPVIGVFFNNLISFDTSARYLPRYVVICRRQWFSTGGSVVGSAHFSNALKKQWQASTLTLVRLWFKTIGPHVFIIYWPNGPPPFQIITAKLLMQIISSYRYTGRSHSHWHSICVQWCCS